MSNVFFYEPFYDLDRLFEEAGPPVMPHHGQVQRRNAPGDGAVRLLKPKMDLHEDNEKNLVTATFELPGLTKNEVQLDVQNNRLTVSGEHTESTDHEDHGYAVRERRFGKFSRTLQLPTGIKGEDIKANMENGILNVTFPKAGPEQAPKKISIS